jgi:hypothetical protein
MTKSKKLLLALLASSMFSVAQAEYTFVVPQKPGGGTSVWAEIVAIEMEKYLDEDIVIRHIPGARDIAGFNKFHNELQHDDKTAMVSHGGNGVSFLQEEVDYDYSDYTSIGLMNLNIIAGKTAGDDMSNPRFSAGSGMVPEAFAMTLLNCGPQETTAVYIDCFKDTVTWVSGMSGGERRLAFRRGELNGTRENPAAFKKHVEPLINSGDAEIWFHHGILQSDGSHNDDPNFPGFQLETLYEKRWGEAPSGDFYNAYKLVKSFRDGLQKAIWVSRDNPNAKDLQDALRQVANSEESMSVIRDKVGDYEWIIGEDGENHFKTLKTFITEDSLQTLVAVNQQALGLDSVYKPDLIND